MASPVVEEAQAAVGTGTSGIATATTTPAASADTGAGTTVQGSGRAADEVGATATGGTQPEVSAVPTGGATEAGQVSQVPTSGAEVAVAERRTAEEQSEFERLDQRRRAGEQLSATDDAWYRMLLGMDEAEQTPGPRVAGREAAVDPKTLVNDIDEDKVRPDLVSLGEAARGIDRERLGSVRIHSINQRTLRAAWESVLDILTNGPDPNHVYKGREHTRGKLYTHNLSDGMALAGSGYFRLLFDPGGNYVSSRNEIRGVLVNDGLAAAAPQILETLRQIYPTIQVGTYSDLAGIAENIINPTSTQQQGGTNDTRRTGEADSGRATDVGIGQPVEVESINQRVAGARTDDEIASTIEAAYRRREGGTNRTPEEAASIAEEEQIVKDLISEAKKDGSLVKISDVTDGKGEIAPHGDEQSVYRSKDGAHAIKFNHTLMSGGFTRLLARLAAHNKHFPESSYRIIGFALDKNKRPTVVLQQPFVKLRADFADMSEHEHNKIVRNKLEERGFVQQGGMWVNADDSMYIADIGKKNVILDENGDLYFVDPLVSDKEFENKSVKELFNIINPSRETVQQQPQQKEASYGLQEKQGQEEKVVAQEPAALGTAPLTAAVASGDWFPRDMQDVFGPVFTKPLLILNRTDIDALRLWEFAGVAQGSTVAVIKEALKQRVDAKGKINWAEIARGYLSPTQMADAVEMVARATDQPRLKWDLAGLVNRMREHIAANTTTAFTPEEKNAITLSLVPTIDELMLVLDTGNQYPYAPASIYRAYADSFAGTRSIEGDAVRDLLNRISQRIYKHMSHLGSETSDLLRGLIMSGIMRSYMADGSNTIAEVQTYIDNAPNLNMNDTEKKKAMAIVIDMFSEHPEILSIQGETNANIRDSERKGTTAPGLSGRSEDTGIQPGRREEDITASESAAISQDGVEWNPEPVATDGSGLDNETGTDESAVDVVDPTGGRDEGLRQELGQGQPVDTLGTDPAASTDAATNFQYRVQIFQTGSIRSGSFRKLPAERIGRRAMGRKGGGPRSDRADLQYTPLPRKFPDRSEALTTSRAMAHPHFFVELVLVGRRVFPRAGQQTRRLCKRNYAIVRPYPATS